MPLPLTQCELRPSVSQTLYRDPSAGEPEKQNHSGARPADGRPFAMSLEPASALAISVALCSSLEPSTSTYYFSNFFLSRSTPAAGSGCGFDDNRGIARLSTRSSSPSLLYGFAVESRLNFRCHGQWRQLKPHSGWNSRGASPAGQ
jgi:hypothetical protein